jgi:hypothetical protein
MTIKEHENELADLVHFFETAEFPQAPFKLNQFMTVVDDPRKLFIKGQVRKIQEYRGTDSVRDGLFRHLRELKAISEAHVSAGQSELFHPVL